MERDAVEGTVDSVWRDELMQVLTGKHPWTFRGINGVDCC